MRKKQKSAGSLKLLRAFEDDEKISSRSGDALGERKHSHCRNQAQIRAADGALDACHPHGGFRSGAAAIFLRAVVAGADAARNADLLGDGLVPWNPLFNGLDHAVLRAIVRPHFLGDDVVVASFHLAGLGAVTGALTGDAEHRAARGKAEGYGDEGGEKN